MSKIVHLVPRDGIGGVESAARSMRDASHLDCEFDLVFIASENPVGNGFGASENSNYSENNPFSHFRAFRRIISSNPELIVCSLWRSVPVGLIVKLVRPKIKLVFFLHSAETAHFFDGLLSKLMLFFCDAVWADSATTISSRVGSRKGLVKRVISFVTKETPVGLKPNKLAPRFVFWGRVHRDKGLDRAVNFIRLLIEKGCPAKYEIWGPDGGELSSLQSQIKYLGLERAVVFKGSANQDELNKIAEDNSFYLQLSRIEGMAMSVVEAMQRSLVPVVTPVGEIGEYCEAKTNAIVVLDLDRPSEAIDELIAVIGNETRYRQFQAAARDYWSKHILYQDDFCKAASELLSPA